MSQLGNILTAIANALQARYPNRVVTRSLRDFSDRSEAELAKGVITLLCRGQDQIEDYQESLNVLLVCQVQQSEDATGELIEEAELALIDDIKAFTGNPPAGVLSMRLVRWQQSQQIEQPYGWINAQVEIGPFDLSELMAPTTDPFLTFHGDFDLAPADGQIDATDEVKLEQ